MNWFKKYSKDIHPLLFLSILIILIAGVIAYIDLKKEIREARSSVFSQVFE